MTLADRVEATNATLAKFRTRPFDWKTGATCIHLARTQARNFGHRPPVIPAFRSAVGARTALRKMGVETVEALLDSLFPRIAPAAMLVGDLAVLPSEDAFASIVIADGQSKLLGWHEAAPGGLRPIARAMEHVTGAWRL